MLFTIKPYNVIDRTDLKEVTVDRAPVIGDPLEVDSNMYLICDINNQVNDGGHSVGVIPLVYKNDSKAFNTENYLESLYIALRRMQDLRIIRFTADELKQFNKELSEIEIKGERLPKMVLDFSGIEAPLNL